MMVSHTSYSGKRFEMFLQNVQKTDYDIKRALMTPDELMRFPSETAIIMKTRMSAIFGAKLTHYIDDNLLSRSEMSFIKEDNKKVKNEWSLDFHNKNHPIKINHDTTDDFSDRYVLI